uniref:Deoxynucleoside kinase domain-containing protein n=1 Tax=viral metagenome TaxID=1070528 RepID=A0A6C0KCB3_9ZZZZ
MTNWLYILPCAVPPLIIARRWLSLKPRQLLVSVEGNIGSGKSTFINLLKLHKDLIPGLCVIPEPVDEWRQTGILKQFYKDPKQWAFHFQVFILITRTRELLMALGDKRNTIIVTERCLETDCMIFAELLRKQNFLNHQEWLLYVSIYRIVKDFVVKKSVEKIIYINTLPDLCCTRIHTRNRQEEKHISMNYIQDVHDQHVKWLGSSTETTTFMHSVNGEIDFTDENSPESNEVIESVRAWLMKI